MDEEYQDNSVLYKSASMTQMGIDLLREAHSNIREARQILSKCNLPRRQMDLCKLSDAEGSIMTQLQAFMYPLPEIDFGESLNVNTKKEGK